MHLLLLGLLLNKFLFDFGVNVGDGDRVILASLPVCLGCFGTIYLVIHFHLLIVVLKVTVRHHVVVSLRSYFNRLASEPILLGRLWALLRRLEMMVFHIDVADDIVVHNCVLTWSEVPGLLLRVVRAVLKTLQFVLKVQDVVSLLVAKSSVLVLSQDLSKVLLFNFSNLTLALRIAEGLGDGIVLHLSRLYVLASHFHVGFSHPLEVPLLILVLLDVIAPVVVAVLEAKLLVSFNKSVTFRRHFPSLQ